MDWEIGRHLVRVASCWGMWTPHCGAQILGFAKRGVERFPSPLTDVQLVESLRACCSFTATSASNHCCCKANKCRKSVPAPCIIETQWNTQTSIGFKTQWNVCVACSCQRMVKHTKHNRKCSWSKTQKKIFIPVPILQFGNPTINFPSPFPGNRKLQPGIRTGNAFIFYNFLMFWLKIVDGGFMKGLWVLFSEFLIFWPTMTGASGGVSQVVHFVSMIFHKDMLNFNLEHCWIFVGKKNALRLFPGGLKTFISCPRCYCPP